ncbi:MAG: prepilin-type N-terminal cleavage/methylation domain-containing protein [Verrucomicrobiota bacterium]
MIRPKQRLRTGFTLVELSIAISLGLIVSSLVLALFNQQLAFLRIYQQQNFLAEEAPLINTHVSRLISGADRFRLHATVDDALNGVNARITESPVMVLNFRQPNGAMRASLLSFEDRGSGNALYYYIVPLAGEIGEPEWFITRRAQNIHFLVEEGVVRMEVTGPADERITYSVSMQL